MSAVLQVFKCVCEREGSNLFKGLESGNVIIEPSEVKKKTNSKFVNYVNSNKLHQNYY